jgi:hypothetical protein
MHNSSITWEDQWNRVKRLSDWVDDIYSTEYQLDQKRSEDIVYSFFINCFHLKDWVINDSSLFEQSSEHKTFIKNLNKRAEKFELISINSYSSGVENLFDKQRGKEHMKLCADIANGAKHFSLERYRIVQDAKVTAKSVNIGQKAASLRFSGPVPCHDEAITSGGATYGFRFGAYDSRELKNKCMREWVNFLKSKKLI